jgi:hypothetical protein
MKKIFLLLLFLPTLLYSQVWNVKDYIIEKGDYPEDYNSYVGQMIKFLPSDNRSMQGQKSFFNKEYIIDNVSYNGFTVVWENIQNAKLSFNLTEKGTGKKRTMTLRNSYYINGRSSVIDSPKINVSSYVIGVLTNKFNNDKKLMIGETFSNPLVRATYKVVDAEIRYDEHTGNSPQLIFTVENSISKEHFEYDAKTCSKDCFKEDLSGNLIAVLYSVEKTPSNLDDRGGKITRIDVNGVTKYEYMDDFIDIIILCEPSQFEFILKNVSQDTQKLIWNEGVFVDAYGNSSKIMHSGIRYSEREKDQSSSVIIRDAMITDVAIPISNVRYDDKLLDDWVIDPIYKKDDIIYGQIRLMLPIQIKDIINDYVFVFNLDYKFDHPDRIYRIDRIY